MYKKGVPSKLGRKPLGFPWYHLNSHRFSAHFFVDNETKRRYLLLVHSTSQLQSDLPSAMLTDLSPAICSLKSETGGTPLFHCIYKYLRKEMEVPPRIELGIRELQSHALPLGYGTKSSLSLLYSIYSRFVKRILQIRYRFLCAKYRLRQHVRRRIARTGTNPGAFAGEAGPQSWK